MRWYLPDGNPMMWHELRRLLRGWRGFGLLLVSGLALSVALIACLVFRPLGNVYDPSAMAATGNRLWGWLMIAQAVLVAVLSPVLTAPIFALERQQRTLEFLLLTPVDSRSIAVGKFWGAVAGLVFMVLAGSPVLALIPAIYGGVPIYQFLLGYVALVLLASYCASVGLYASLHRPQVWRALIEAYMLTLLGTGIAGILSLMCFAGLKMLRSISITGTLSLICFFSIPLLLFAVTLAINACADMLNTARGVSLDNWIYKPIQHPVLMGDQWK